ncbi:MAG: hypothetical protein BWY74_02934 [Firmicutes bacterium ADurb.Bin419]|nr:MAG: hypothetical protein BWY74_02934 [Firmicutes bacterium ADurb.Bin419]
MNCQKCGTLIPEDAKFCIECGEYVADFKQEHVNTFESNKDYSPDVFDSDNINPASNNFLLLTSENDSLNKVIEKKSKKKLLLILSVVTIFIAVVSMVSVYFYNNIYLVNKQVSAVLTKVDSKSYKDAKEIYDEINNDSDNSKRTIIITSVDKKLSSRIDKLTLDYIKNDTDYSELEG